MNSRHARQSFLGADIVTRTDHARVAIIGLCGGGSHIAQQLAHIGIGNFELVDFDNTDITNSNRMVGLSHTQAQAQAPKVDVIAQRIREINPLARIRTHSRRWSEVQDDLKHCTTIIACVDRYDEREALERFTRRYLIPYLDVGMDVHETADGFLIAGQVIASLPGHPCLRCFGFITDERLAAEAAQYGHAGGNPQVVWPNGVLASTAVGKFMQLLSPWSKRMSLALYTEYDGNRDLLRPSHKLAALTGVCPHFSELDVGDVRW